MAIIMARSYQELITFPTFEERFQYLVINQKVGDQTFGSFRFMNQAFYKSEIWKRVRRDVIVRDMGCNLAHMDFLIPNGVRLIIHHINPLLPSDMEDPRKLLDMDNLILTDEFTHNRIHYGNDIWFTDDVERKPFDTCPWRIQQN